MGKKEEEDIIRIAKKIDKMAQKKNGVRYLKRMNASVIVLMLMFSQGWR